MKPTPLTAARLQVIRQMTAGGAGNKTIAAYLGIRPSMVSKLRTRYGLPPAPRRGPTHGRASTYGRYGCRCAPCTKANTRACTVAAQRRFKRRDTATFEHGEGGYRNWGCRCDVCTAGNTEAGREPQRRWRERQRAAKAGAS